MTASGAKLSLDAPPFSLVVGDRARVLGLNEVGLRRRGMEAETLRVLKRVFRITFRSGLRLEQAASKLQAESSAYPEVDRLLRFLQKSERGFCR